MTTPAQILPTRSLRLAALVAGLAAACSCSRPPSHPADAGTTDGGPAGTCLTFCGLNDGGPNCASGETCSFFILLNADDSPMAANTPSDGVCVPNGTVPNACVAASSCSKGQLCTTAPQENLTSALADTTFEVQTHMLAAVEMQLSGEPLAESMGRALSGYSRDEPTPNIYFDAAPQDYGAWIDLVGFATAVESYEYSKQPMNELNFESGAGMALAYGPVLNPPDGGVQKEGAGAIALLRAADENLALNAGLSPDAGAIPIVSWGRTLDAGFESGVNRIDGGSPPNLLGWPGFWPTTEPYEQFNPAIHPVDTVYWPCSIASDDTPGSSNLVLNEDYECDYTSLHLPSRSGQISNAMGPAGTFALSPGSSGWAGWKSALWVMNYLQIMHDTNENPIDTVDAGVLSQVGNPNNQIMGTYQGVPSGVAGVYVGSSNIEGFQAGNMIMERENEAQEWLAALNTADGTTLSSFAASPNPCTAQGFTPGPLGCDPVVLSAIQYDYTSPLRWLPSQIAVTESNPDWSYGADGGFPQPVSFAITASDSNLLYLDGLLGSFSSMYTITDRNNAGVGGAQTAEVYFDGDPFPQDDGLADGEPDLHDRSLAMMRFLVVAMDRLHTTSSGVLIDDVTFSGNTPTQGVTVATSSVAYTIVALRNVRRSLASLLQLYSNTTPDEAVAPTTPLDNVPLNGAPGGATFTQRVTTLLNAQATLLMNNLTTSSGQAFDGWNVQTNAPVDNQDILDSYTAAIRGLLAAYLSTGSDAYRTRAIAVFQHMDSVFYDPSARIYDVTPAPNATIAYTPMRFAMLEGSLRDLWELYGNQPGQSSFGQLIQNRLQRLIKLVLNGWDDQNSNGVVDFAAGSCTQANTCSADCDDGWVCAPSAFTPGAAVCGVYSQGDVNFQCVNTATCQCNADFVGSECTDVMPAYPRGGLQMAERALSGELGSLNDDINTLNPATHITTIDREGDCVPDIAAVGLPSALANEVDFTVVKP